MYTKKSFSKNTYAVSPVLESLVAIGISISLLTVFFVTTNSVYSTHDRPDVDLEAKSVDLLESLIYSPGESSGYNESWEGDPANISQLGLSTNPAITYGVINISEDGTIIILKEYKVTVDEIGLRETCFLAGTKVVMADGSSKNIEDIVIGDIVKSYDMNTQTIVDCLVTNVLHHAKEEMGEYYLLINGWMHITPNHCIYSQGQWITADQLHIGDSLGFNANDLHVTSIAKIYHQEKTYNLEIEQSHTYFVTFADVNDDNILVHNDLDLDPPDPGPSWENPPTAEANGPYEGNLKNFITFSAAGTTVGGCGPPPPFIFFITSYEWDFGDGSAVVDSYPLPWIKHEYQEPGEYTVTLTVYNNCGNHDSDTADVTVYNCPFATYDWFDSDGTYHPGLNMTFDASDSTTPNGDIAEYQWWWDWNISANETQNGNADKTTTDSLVRFDLPDNSSYWVRLKVFNSAGSNHSIVQRVSANNDSADDIEYRPWILTSKDIFPDVHNETFTSYSDEYYITYTLLEDSNWSFVIKKQNRATTNILDYNKSVNLSNVEYETAKDLLGLNLPSVHFQFNVTIYNDVGILCYLGPSFEHAEVVVSNEKEILLYHKPRIESYSNITAPYYEKGMIVVTAFF